MHPPSGRTILVLDDDPDVRRLVTLALSRHGHRVVPAATTREALELVKRDLPDLLVVDLMLPEHDGEAFLEACRERLPKRPPVVLLTASAARREVARRVEADIAMAKPFELAELAAVVDNLLA